MKKNIITLIMIMSVMTLVLSGCSTNKKEHDSDSALAPEKNTYRNQLTEEELELDYIELELAETVKLNGTITPQSKYAEGLNIYHTEYMSPLTIDILPEEWDSLIYDKAQEVMNIIENESTGIFDRDKLEMYTDYSKELPVSFVSVPYTKADGTEKVLRVDFFIDDEKCVYVNTLSFGDENNENKERNIAYFIRSCTPDYSKETLSFGGETAGDIFARTFIEELTGDSLIERNVCVPVDRERYDEMKEHYLGEFSEESPREEYYHYYYYRQIDGFKSNRLFTAINTETLGDADVSLARDPDTNQISLEGASASYVSYDADGVRSISISDMWNVGDVYKEKEAIVSINEILKKCTKYFEDYFSSRRIEVQSIELCYGQSITDNNGEPIQKVWCPFWVVEYAVKPVYTTTCSTECVMYDAFTGDRIGMAPNALDN